MTEIDIVAANARVERLRPWRVAQWADGTFTVTRGNGEPLVMNREEAEHVAYHLGLLLKLTAWAESGIDLGKQ
jgi:hypothetical protein